MAENLFFLGGLDKRRGGADPTETWNHFGRHGREQRGRVASHAAATVAAGLTKSGF